MNVFSQVLPLLKSSLNKECCRKRVGDGYSLVIEFGERIYHNKVNRIDTFTGEWSFSTYNRAWRVIHNNQMILGGESQYINHISADNDLQKIPMGKLDEIIFRNNLDLILKLDNNISIEFLSCCHNEESFTIFLPNREVLVFDVSTGWVYGKSDEPWPNYLHIDN